jgi:hypothetical protein
MRNIFAKVVEKIKIHNLCSKNILRKLCPSWNNVEKYGIARKATDDNTIQWRKNLIWQKYRHALIIFNTYYC